MVRSQRQKNMFANKKLKKQNYPKLIISHALPLAWPLIDHVTFNDTRTHALRLASDWIQRTILELRLTRTGGIRKILGGGKHHVVTSPAEPVPDSRVFHSKCPLHRWVSSRDTQFQLLRLVERRRGTCPASNVTQVDPSNCIGLEVAYY